MRIGSMVLALTLVAGFIVTARADDTEPDFSKDALLLILRDQPDSISEVIEEKLTWRQGRLTFRWLPIVMPLPTSFGEHGHAQIHSPVNPFALLGMDYPGGEPQPYLRDLSRSEVRYRGKMVRLVAGANRRDNRAPEITD